MRESVITANGKKVRTISLNTIVVGTGAAGYNAADRLYSLGQHDIAMVTEGINSGTSRNTGSDKQTYYKLSLSGDSPDSVRAMADVYFSGQAVDGEHALCEASLSARCFLKLVELGVPFPKNRYGEYIGYKTDHDPARRATSVGPYTSKRMTECLQKAVEDKGIKVYDCMQVVKILKSDNKTVGVLCVNLDCKNDEDTYVAFNAKSVVFATGGPAGIYADSVFPLSQFGATGIALEAGAKGKNLTEWQFGLASVNPRWNVSGTYMQVLPKFVSTDKDGNDPQEFLSEFFTDKSDMLSKIFLKGYQWPFDVRKVNTGSSIIDILVYIETCIKGRRVFLDFRANPDDADIDFNALDEEALDYLKKAGACFGTPIERLKHMNQPAVDFYNDKGVDITTEPLEIALCAQHNNGGLSIDLWWQTNIEGLFAVGEAAASHGVYRPGGSALNAGQVGSTRAAEFIAATRTGDPLSEDDFEEVSKGQIAEAVTFGSKLLSSVLNNVEEKYTFAAKRMSMAGGAIRDSEAIKKALEELKQEISDFESDIKIDSVKHLAKAFRLHETLICQYVYLSAMLNYSDGGNGSRGSALYSNKKGKIAYKQLPDIFKFILDDEKRKDQTQEVTYANGSCDFSWRKVNPIPEDDDFFENVWREFRENGNVY